MQTSLQGIINKARKEKRHRFNNLYSILNEEFLLDTWKTINKKSASGIDKLTAEEYGKNLKENISCLVEKLKNKKYHARLIKRVYIPKGEGKLRPLGLPSLEDKLVQAGVARILSAIFEQDFIENSYGYRSHLSPHDAIKSITKTLQFGLYGYIVEADIKGFFDNVNHDWLVKMLEERVNDKALIRLIKKWLKAGIMETDGKIIHPHTGTPQGAIVSPILANIYLHYALDLWFEKVVKQHCDGEVYICRYADDFICAFRFKRDAIKFFKSLKLRLNKFSLELAEDKTKILKFNRFAKDESETFDFLGFTFYYGIDRKGKVRVKRKTSQKKLKKSLKTFKDWCKEHRNCRLRKIFDLLNSKLMGYYNYYGLIGNYEAIRRFYLLAMKILFKWLNRRSQRRSFNWYEFNQKLKYYKVEMPRTTEKVLHQLSFRF
jgi:RNA-directed DNA polymerase